MIRLLTHNHLIITIEYMPKVLKSIILNTVIAQPALLVTIFRLPVTSSRLSSPTISCLIVLFLRSILACCIIVASENEYCQFHEAPFALRRPHCPHVLHLTLHPSFSWKGNCCVDMEVWGIQISMLIVVSHVLLACKPLQ